LRNFLFPESRGVFPNDESVYGVRDMAGSVLEPTISRTIGGYVSFRGGWYGTADDYLFHASTRFGRTASSAQHDAGIRLIAEATEK
jgi:formylglycine-generating enzyme required for sulfatase activity